MTTATQIRFLEKLVAQPGGCIIWGNTKDRYGYGRFKLGGKMVKAHRVAYEIAYGPIPVGLVIDHVHAKGCTSRACCNPDHLEAVTQRVNVQRIIRA